MSGVVEGEADGHDEDHAGDDLDGEAAEVGVARDECMIKLLVVYV